MFSPRVLLLACACLLGPRLAAAPLKYDSLKVGDKVYQDVTVLGSNATDLYFSHAKGIANVRLKYLSPDLQKEFHFDAATAAAAERAQVEQDALYQQTVATRVTTDASAAMKAPPPPRTSDESLADPVSDQSLLGKPGPKLDLQKWISDKPDLEGKFVLISFWAPWSMPCRKCIPDLNDLQKKFANKLAIVGVSSGTENEVAETPDLKLSFALAADPGAKLSHAAGVTSIPSVLLLDPNGIVRYQGHPAALTDKKLQRILEKAAE